MVAVEGEMLTLLMDGAVLPTVTDAEPLPVAPLESVAVTVQKMLSPGLAVLLVKVRLEPVPSVEDPFVHT